MPESKGNLPFAQMIRDLRLQIGLSQEELASRLNVDISVIQEWEDRSASYKPELAAIPLDVVLRAYHDRLNEQKQTSEGWSNRKLVEELLTAVKIVSSHIINIFNKTDTNNWPETPRYTYRIRMVVGHQMPPTVESFQIEETKNPPQPFTETSYSAMLPEINPPLLADLATILVTTEPESLRIHYSHTLPEHGSRIVDEGKFKNKEEQQQSDRLITLKEAVALYPDEVSYGDVLRWHYSGRLEEKGRQWLARPGGRSIPLVSQAQLAHLKDHRPPVGKQISKHRRSRSKTT